MYIAIVEDENDAAEKLSGFIARFFEKKNLSFKLDRFSDGSEFLEKYRPVYDVVFMDIEMPHMNGMDAAKELRTIDCNVVLIFVTNMSKYAVKGYLVDALGYMVKPITYFQFLAQMEKACVHVALKQGRKISLKLVDGMKALSTNEILYIESIGHKLVYHTFKEEFNVYRTMNEAERELNVGCKTFFYCHRSILVNMNFVTAIDKNGVTVGGVLLPVSRLRYKEFIDDFCNFMSRNHSGGII